MFFSHNILAQTADQLFIELDQKWNSGVVRLFADIQQQIEVYRRGQYKPLLRNTEPLIKHISNYFQQIINIINEVDQKLKQGFFQSHDIQKAEQYLGETKMTLINDAHRLSAQAKNFDAGSALPHYLLVKHSEFSLLYTEAIHIKDIPGPTLRAG